MQLLSVTEKTLTEHYKLHTVFIQHRCETRFVFSVGRNVCWAAQHKSYIIMYLIRVNLFLRIITRIWSLSSSQLISHSYSVFVWQYIKYFFRYKLCIIWYADSLENRFLHIDFSFQKVAWWENVNINQQSTMWEAFTHLCCIKSV